MKEKARSVLAARRRAAALLGAVLATAGLVLTVAVSPARAAPGGVPDGRAVTGAGEITAMYVHGLNRAPDAAGLAQYMSFVNQNCRWGVLSGSFQILNSAEAHNVWHNDPRTLAGMLYAALLNRAPDAGGLATYTTAIQQRGLPWATASMMASSEYNTRLSRICTSPSETATMYTAAEARSWANSLLLHNASTEALICGGSKVLDKVDTLISKEGEEAPVVEFVSTALSIETWIISKFHLDGSCGAVVAYAKSAAKIYLTADGGQDNPVFIQYSVGNPAILTGQRAFTVRIGPDPAHWTGYSGKGW